jgi:hypothetical protein
VISTGRDFRVFFDWRFEDVVATKGVPPLSYEVRQCLHANLLDSAIRSAATMRTTWAIRNDLRARSRFRCSHRR